MLLTLAAIEGGSAALVLTGPLAVDPMADAVVGVSDLAGIIFRYRGL